jgi:hypothetical protein
MPDFFPGIVLAKRFYRDAVRPILDEAFPGLAHAAGLIGFGSEVLGLDTPISADHHWGPRVMLFLGDQDYDHYAGPIRDVMRRRLPTTCLGWSTNFSTPDLADQSVERLEPACAGDINHRVEVQTVPRFFRDYLGLDVLAPLTVPAWLTLPSQKLATVTTGELFYDGVGLEQVRQRFKWYPHDVWLYQMAAGWTRVGQEEHLVGRAGQVGDDLGSRVIAARLVRDLMRLCFLIERQYAPYAKWFGTAFGRLKAAPGLQPALGRVLAAASWPERDRALGEAYAAVARLHNGLGLTDPLPADPVPFHGRPFTVIFGDRFAETLRARVADPEVRALPFPIGGVDQWSDSSDLLEPATLRPRLEALYVSAETSQDG